MTEQLSGRGSRKSEDAFRAMLRAYGLIRRVMDPFFAQYGISGSQWGLLRTLHRAEQEGLPGLRLTDLGERLLIRPPSVTTAVDRTEEMGLVARTASSTDMRAKYVSLTQAGRDLLVRIQADHKAQVQEVLSGLTQQQQRTLHELLDRWGEHLEEMAENNGEEN